MRRAPPIAQRIRVVPSLEHLDAELSERSLYHFMQCAWGTVEPKDFQGNWHIEVICEHLEAVSRGEIRNLIITIPPRHTKSMSVSVMWPAWEWGPLNKPGTRFLFVSYDRGLTIRDSAKCRQIIGSSWYQQYWGDRVKLLGDQNAKQRYHTTAGGCRVATTVGGGATGEGGDRLVIDDPINVKLAHSDVARRDVNDWWDNVMSSRLNDPRKGARVIIMQRCHANDLVGHIEETASVHYEKLVLPAEYEPRRKTVTMLGEVDRRKREGELLWPDRFTAEEMAQLKKQQGAYQYTAQYQQSPTQPEGNIFKRHWWQFYLEDPASKAMDMEWMFQSWDLAFKATDHSDYVVGAVWGVKGSQMFRLAEKRGRLSFTESVAAVRELSRQWPEATLKLIEDKANGPAVIDFLKKEIRGIVAVNPEGSKESRAFAITPELEAGNIFLPVAQNADWVNDYIEELAAFNRGTHDDRVDETTQAIREARRRARRYDMPAPVSLTQTNEWRTMGS